MASTHWLFFYPMESVAPGNIRDISHALSHWSLQTLSWHRYYYYSFSQMKNWRSERGSHWFKAGQLVSDWAGMGTQLYKCKLHALIHDTLVIHEVWFLLYLPTSFPILFSPSSSWPPWLQHFRPLTSTYNVPPRPDTTLQVGSGHIPAFWASQVQAF